MSLTLRRARPEEAAALGDIGFAAWEARVEKIREPEPLDWLRQMGEAFLDFALTQPRRYEAAFLLKASAARRYPGDFVAGRSPVISKFMARVEEAKAQGVIGQVPTIDITIHFTALTQGLVDMYRAVIEHPEFMPTELKNRPDLTLGKERGRIWRIAPEARSSTQMLYSRT